MAVWAERRCSPNARGYGVRHAIDEPLPTMTTVGLAGSGAGGGDWYWMTDETETAMAETTIETEKPPYRIPTMAEIAERPRNGLRVLSTFSGCGGSCLGFRMAGYETLWANEFVAAARETYAANFPDVPISDADIRTVDFRAVLAELGLARGEIDVLEGSPPCASFSTAGKRHAHWGQEKTYSDTRQRTDDLFFQFVRALDELAPRAFVAENVSGLVKGVAKGYFKEILRALRATGYRVEARLLDAQWLGVPQRRQRIIFVGVRNDLDRAPAFPEPLPYRYSIRDACPWIGAVSGRTASGFAREPHPVDGPIEAVLASGNEQTRYQVEIRKVGVRDVVDDHVAAGLDGYAIADEWRTLRPGESSERYLNLARAHPDQPVPTITASGAGVSDGVGVPGGVASVTHPTEPRKFAIAELRRLCGFPDDFVLTGTYAQQWERLGRAVPPPMMRAVAETLAREVFDV